MMKKARVKCYNDDCDKIIEGHESTILQVVVIHENGSITAVPTCCEECASKVQQKYVKIHKSRLHDMENQCFQKMAIKYFLHLD